MDETTTGIVTATQDDTVVHVDVSDTDYRIAALETRLASLEEDFSKLTAFVNTIYSKLK